MKDYAVLEEVRCPNCHKLHDMEFISMLFKDNTVIAKPTCQSCNTTFHYEIFVHWKKPKPRNTLDE